MSNPGQFKDFSKAAGDLLSKVFPGKIDANTWGFEYDLKPTNFFKSTAKLSNSNNLASGELSSEIVLEDFGITVKDTFKTKDPELDISIAIDKELPVDGLSAKLHLNAKGSGDKSSQTGGLSIAYKHESLTLNSRVHVPITKAFVNFVSADALDKQDTKIDVDFVLTHPDYKVFLGGLSKISIPSDGARNIDEAQFKLGYRDADVNGAIGYKTTSKTNAKDGSKDVSQNVSVQVFLKPGETGYVADLGYDLGKQQATLALGAEYPLNDGANLKVKLDTDKNIGLAYTNKFAKGTELQFGTLLNVDTGDAASINLSSAFNFSLKFSQ